MATSTNKPKGTRKPRTKKVKVEQPVAEQKLVFPDKPITPPAPMIETKEPCVEEPKYTSDEYVAQYKLAKRLAHRDKIARRTAVVTIVILFIILYMVK